MEDPAAENLSPPSLSVPNVTVFTATVQRQLLILSVFVIFFDVIQLICQVSLVVQARHLIISVIVAAIVCWTLLLFFLTARWILILSRNHVEIVKKGKFFVVGCTMLSILNLSAAVALIFMEHNHRDVHERDQNDDNFEWLIGCISGCNSFNLIIYTILLFFNARGQRDVHRVIGSWLWLHIQQHIQILQRQQVLLEDGSLAAVSDYLQSVYDQETLNYSASAA